MLSHAAISCVGSKTRAPLTTDRGEQREEPYIALLDDNLLLAVLDIVRTLYVICWSQAYTNTELF